MSVDWPKKPLGKLLELVIDHRGKTPKKMGFSDFHSEGYPVLSAKHVKTDVLVNVEAIRFANEQMYKKWMKVEVQEGDVVLTSEAPMGEVYYLDGKVKYVLGQRVFGLRPKKTDIHPLYLTAWLTSSRGQEQLASRASGSTVLGIKQSELLKIDVDLPPYEVQEKIAKIRYDFTRKIAINTQTNQTLEQIAQAIFKSWFVDFEPVKAKIAVLEAGGTAEQAELAAMSVISGKDETALKQLQAEQPDRYQELAETAALFPSAMVESELGEIPEGWEVVGFSEIATLDTTSVKPNKSPDKVWDHFSIPAFDVNQSPAKELGATIKSGKYKVKKTAILSSKLNPHFPRTWWPDIEDEESAICSTEFMQFIPKKDEDRPFIYCLITSSPFQEGILQRVTGTTGSRQRAQPPQVAAMDVIIPRKELIDKFSNKAFPLLDRKAKNIKQNNSLSDLRDTLLPKLLSGEIDLSLCHTTANQEDK